MFSDKFVPLNFPISEPIKQSIITYKEKVLSDYIKFSIFIFFFFELLTELLVNQSLFKGYYEQLGINFIS